MYSVPGDSPLAVVKLVESGNHPVTSDSVPLSSLVTRNSATPSSSWTSPASQVNSALEASTLVTWNVAPAEVLKLNGFTGIFSTTPEELVSETVMVPQ